LGSRLHRYCDRPPSEDDVIAWVRCPSLVRPGEHVWVPAQLLFLGFTTSTPHQDLLPPPSVSTGTAAHTSVATAPRTALITAVQTGAVILNWYTSTPAPAVVLDDPGLQRIFAGMDLGPDAAYRIRAGYLTRPELPLPTLGVFLERGDDRLPKVSFGVQGDA